MPKDLAKTNKNQKPLKHIILLVGLSIIANIASSQSNESFSFTDLKSKLNYIDEGSQAEILIQNENNELEIFSLRARPIFNRSVPSNYHSITAYHGFSLRDPSKEIHITLSDSAIQLLLATNNARYKSSKTDTGYKWLRSESINHSVAGCFATSIGSANKVRPKKLRSNTLLEYEVAISTTPAFSSIHGSTEQEVLFAIVTYLNQINTIYERELGIRLVLASNNDKIIFLDEQNDPFPEQKGAALNKNKQILADSIGIDNYDIGHLLTIGGGGVANVSVACTSNKSAGISGFEAGDNFHKLLAHEIGHQIGAGHTWNSCTNSLNQIQRSPSAAMEPGSGTTIMSYAGLCGANNVDTRRNEFFHAISIEQIVSYTRQDNGILCPQEVNIPNTPPIITELSSIQKSIPIRTPFKVTGQAIDNEDSAITYAWDQIDQSVPLDLGDQNQYSPLFRSRPPTAKGVRYFPELSTLANGTIDPSELLPNQARSIELRMVVRDNHPDNGNIAWSDLELNTDDDAGPFTIDESTTTSGWLARAWHPVMWDVANTDNPKVDCQLVDILIDYEGLLEFKDTLAFRVPNDGLHYIQLPDTVSTGARLMISASDNLFFDISDASFDITRTSDPGFQIHMDTTALQLCELDPISVGIRVANQNFFSTPIRFSTTNLPEGINLEFSDNDIIAGNDISILISFDSDIERKSYPLQMNAFAAGGTSQDFIFTIDLQDNNLSPVQLRVPENGMTLDEPTVPFSWSNNDESANNTIEVSTTSNFQSVLEFSNPTTNLNNLNLTLPKDTAWFWRVKSDTDCSPEVISEIGTFGIKSTVCVEQNSFAVPVSISENIDSITSSITISEDIIIQNISLLNVSGSHSYVGDLSFILIPPNGVPITLISQVCNEDKGFEFSISSTGDRLRCPIDRGMSYLPEQSFDNLIGQNAKGEWILKIVDHVFGDGGQLDNWALSICALKNPGNPILVNSDTLKLTPASSKILSNSNLSYSDIDNNSEEITYVITKPVSRGFLILGTDTLTLGDTFSQADLDNETIKYQHSNSIEEADKFSYVVLDGEGYISSPKDQIIDIKIGVNVDNLKEVFGITIFPNPAHNELIINNFSPNFNALKISIITLDGKILLSNSIPSGSDILRVNIEAIPSGIHLVHILSNNQYGVQKIVVIR